MAVVRVQQCDRCMKIINQIPQPEDPPTFKGPVFRLTFGEVGVTYTDLCEKCMRRLDALFTEIVHLEVVPELEGSVVALPKKSESVGGAMGFRTHDDDWAAVEPEPLPVPKVRGQETDFADDDFEED